MDNRNLPKVETHLYIDGKWVEGSEEPVAVTNPATGEALEKIQQGGVAETKQAIQAAKRSFSTWSKTSPKKRAELMNKLADLIEEDTERLAKIMTMEQGKPLSQAKSEIQTDVENMRWNASEGQRLVGEIIPSPDTNL